MRVLISTITYFPTIGGADDFARSIAAGVHARGHEVLVVTTDLERHVAGHRVARDAPREVDGVPVARCRAWLPPGHVYPVWPGFFREARRFRPDIVHGFGLGYFSADAAALLAPRVPALISPTGGRYRRGRLYGILRATLLARTRAVRLWTALSRDERRALNDAYAPNVPPIALLAPSLDLQEWGLEEGKTRNNEREISLPADPFPLLPRGGRILFTGRLARDKGVPDLLAAFARLRVGRNDDRRVTLILAGPDYGLGPLALAPDVLVTGPLDRATLFAAYHHCDLLALPSYHEGFGIVLTEAMAAGKPVVAYDNSSMPELCRDGENGILVRTGDVAGLEAALVRLVDDPALRQRMGRSGQQRARKDFERSGMIDRVLELYRAVLAGPQAAASSAALDA